jgi:predicted nuclease of predicted toxin-antitoxin system
MKFLANENFPRTSIEILSKAGYDIIGIGIDYSGILDVEVIEIAQKENRTILTFEKILTVISEGNIRQRKYL